MEELEDDEGNVYNKKTYEDLKKQGLIQISFVLADVVHLYCIDYLHITIPPKENKGLLDYFAGPRVLIVLRITGSGVMGSGRSAACEQSSSSDDGHDDKGESPGESKGFARAASSNGDEITKLPLLISTSFSV